MNQIKATTCNTANYAADYDQKVESAGYIIPEILFGLVYGLLERGSKVLDIGTGSGRVARLFYKAGMELHGIDRSSEMLELCGARIDYKSLYKHDLLIAPYPYASGSMDCITCAGVMNHIQELDVIFSECTRILANNGYFGFMTGYSDTTPSKLTITHNNTHHTLQSHTDTEIAAYLAANGLTLVHSLPTSVNSSYHPDFTIPVKLYIARKDEQ